jgi:hypothetical protein
MSDWNGIGVVASLLGALVGVIAAGFAVFEYRKRVKTEQLTKAILRHLAGDLRVVFSNANWVDNHFRRIAHLFAEEQPYLKEIKNRVVDGSRDAAACSRQLAIAHYHTDDVKAAHQSKAVGSPGEIIEQK